MSSLRVQHDKWLMSLDLLLRIYVSLEFENEPLTMVYLGISGLQPDANGVTSDWGVIVLPIQDLMMVQIMLGQ